MGLWPEALRAFLTRHRALIVAGAFFIVTFLVYRLLGAPATPYNNFVRQADAFLHGRVNLAENLTYLELILHDGKYYVIPPPWPAIVMLPGVILFGLALNQTLVSVVIGAVNASVVSTVVGSVTRRITTQVWLTVLFLFGTVYWYAAANGGVWFFSHTVAVLFLFAAIYFTIKDRRPFWAGLCLGAAYWSRQPTVLALPFFVIMFSDLWLPPAAGKSLRERLNIRPLMALGAGLGIFLVLSFIYNYLRFGTPLDASQHLLPESVLAQPWFNHGPFDYRYIPRHTAVMLQNMPIIRMEAPYVLPSWGGMALWATTPAFFYALFAGVKDRRVAAAGWLVILVTTGIIISKATARVWGDLALEAGAPQWLLRAAQDAEGWHTYQFQHQLNLLPFYALIAMAIYTGRHDKFVLACWAGLLPVALMLFTFAGTGFAQFGYRFGLDFMPFLFLLTVKGMGDDLKWHHKLMIVASVIVNLWGVVWIYQFDRHHYLGLSWVGW
ncbi:MAG: hypothetical protein Q7T33_04445 [Dehalococcoidia bacterium]|nr:hypothetical protein [Dehalococcoidia bacterium]